MKKLIGHKGKLCFPLATFGKNQRFLPKGHLKIIAPFGAYTPLGYKDYKVDTVKHMIYNESNKTK
jgi:hypothetical protein